MTQLKKSRENKITKEMRIVAKAEKHSLDFIRKNIANGKIVIPANKFHKNLKPIGIGYRLKTKINANIGTSPYKYNINEELEKLKISVKHGADVVMDLSTGGDLNKIRKTLIKNSPIPFGTVPIYQTVVENDLLNINSDNLLDTIELQAKQGVDFVTVHAGLTRNAIPLLKRRLTGVVSRGGSFLVKWMKHHKKENPLYSNYEALLDIAHKYDLTLSLGDGLRPGSIKDATDKAQIHELKILGKLTKRAWEKDVQVMIEGPGHVPINQIEKNIKMQKKYCYNAPFYVLGPLVTDIAPGYDHITGAIGGALAGYYGADFLCYLTPAEHLRLPSIDDVKEGVIVTKIAAHAADIAKGIKGAIDRDHLISKYRKQFDWEKQFSLAIDPDKARSYRKESKIKDKVCTMCGEFCSMK